MFEEILARLAAALGRHDILKIFAGRPRDLEDVATIVRNQPELDRAYIRRWLEEFDAGSDNAGFLARFLAILAAC